MSEELKVANEKSFEWIIKSGTHTAQKMKPGQRLATFFTLDDIEWAISFYPHGKLDKQGQERKNSEVYLNYMGELSHRLPTFEYHLKMSGHQGVRKSRPNIPCQLSKHNMVTSGRFVPRNDLLSCVTSEDTLIITITLSKK